MKKIVPVLLLFVAMLSVNRVSAQAGIAAGYLSQQHTFNYKGALDSLGTLMENDAWLRGGFLGLTQSVPLIGKIGITPGLFVSFAQIKQAVSDTSEFTTSSLMLKVPFLLDYDRELGPNSKLFFFAGPVFNVALSTLANYRSVGDQMDIHFDMGGMVGAGLQFYRVRIFAGYNIGLIDRDEFSLANKESVSKAWEGSSFFAGLGVSLGRRQTEF